MMLTFKTVVTALLVAAAATVSAEPPPEVVSAREALAEAFDSEVRDDPWAAASENLISGVFAVAGIDVIDLSVHCATTMCRIEFSAPAGFEVDDAAIEAVDATIREAHLAGRMRQGFVIHDGATHLCYFTREGFVLPESAM